MPEVIGVAAAAQFAISKERVLRRPLEFYVRARQWLLATRLNDATSGRVLEHLWHVFFGDEREAVYCPSERQCRCDVYGLCSGEGYGKQRRADFHSAYQQPHVPPWY